MVSRGEKINGFNFIRKLHPWLSILPAFVLPPLFFLFDGVHLSWLVGTLVAIFFVDNLGVQIGVHKLLSHRSFETSPLIRRVLASLAVLSGQGSPLFWVAVHMGAHHPNYDTEKDVHSPVRGRFHAFIAWYWRSNPKQISFSPAREYLRDRYLLFLHRNHTLVLISYWLLLLCFGIRSVVYLGLLPIAISISLVGIVNTFMHRKGNLSDKILMKYQTHDDGTTFNSILLGAMTMGLGLHNNHHHAPHKPYYSEKWYEIDLSRFIIPVIEIKGSADY